MDYSAYYFCLQRCVSMQIDLIARIALFDQRLDSLEFEVIEQILEIFETQFRSLRQTYPQLDHINKVLLQHNPHPEGKVAREGFQILNQKDAEIQEALEEIDSLVDSLFEDED